MLPINGSDQLLTPDIMRPLISLLLLLFVGLQIQAQGTPYITGLSNPQDMKLMGDELYFAEYDAGRIVKVNLLDPEPMPEVVFGVNQPLAFAIDGNTLYFSQFQNGNHISKIDLTDPNPVPEIVVPNVVRAFDLEFRDGYLWVAHFGLDRVLKIDVSDPIPALEVVAEGIETAHDLEFVGNDLYVVSWAEDEIVKLDLTDPNPTPVNVISNLWLPVGITHRQNEMYIAEAGQSIGSDRISRINIGEGNLDRTTILDGLYNPTKGIVIHDNTLYIAENFQITTTELPVLSNDDIQLVEVGLYPNPTSQSIQFSGLKEPMAFQIYNVTGALIAKGTATNQEIVDTSFIPTGSYFVHLENGQVLRLIKR